MDAPADLVDHAAGGARDNGTSPALRIRNVSKSFAGAKALDDVSLEVGHGEIHALLGGNGCGKSTLIKILAGVYQADDGILSFPHGEIPASSTTPALAREHRLRFVHQDPGLFADLSVADNVAMRTGFPTRLGRIRTSALHARVRTLLETYDVRAGPGDTLGDLRPADQTMVAIARAMERDDDDAPTLLVLDEPTASLPQEEVDVLLKAVRKCARDGQGIIYVSHRIDEVLAIADRVTVLRDGKVIVSMPSQGVTEAQLTEYIAGRPIDSVFGSRSDSSFDGPTVLTARGLSGGPLRDVSFDLHAGEVLGVAGLLGSGRTELLQMIFGLYPRAGGTITLDGRELPESTSPRPAMERGLAFVPEDRAVDAAFPELSLSANLSMAQVSKYRRALSLSASRELADAQQSIGEFGIKPARPSADFATLSGGNQQKAVLARWLRRSPRVLLLDEPTQGVDVGARADSYAAIRRATDSGMGVLLVSSDFEELAHACDRVLVLHDGEITAEVMKADLDRATLTHLTYRGKGTPQP